MLDDPGRTMLNIRYAETDDLLSRVTFERAGMEPEAVTLAELELERRGVTPEEQAAFLAKHDGCLHDASGLPLRCSRCPLPARVEVLASRWLWGKIPLFPRRVRYCADHLPPPKTPGAEPTGQR